jgi:outer membrane protein TolC
MMTHHDLSTGLLLLLLASLSLSCRSHDEIRFDPDCAVYPAVVQEIEYPEVAELNSPCAEHSLMLRPPSVSNFEELEPWPLTLEATVDIALQNSQVIREIGGLVVTQPAAARTLYDPAIQETSPQTGLEAALSAFDAQFATGLFIERQERRFNNAFIAGGDVDTGGQVVAVGLNPGDFRAEISKATAAGTRFAVRNLTLYDRSNVPSGTVARSLNSFYDTLFQIEARHPLLQGSGVEFNRIAGPNAMPGVYNGVLLARINTDVSLVDFELAVRDLLRDVERAYWELHYSYRNLDARKKARQFSLDQWQRKLRRAEQGFGLSVDESLARQQFYANQARVENALSGGTVGGQGVYTAERTLRRLMGMPPIDGRLIRPVSQPSMARIEFSWDESLQECFVRRAELRRQKWSVKRRELELIAAKNMRLPRLDLVAQYGWRGWGDDLLGAGSVTKPISGFDPTQPAVPVQFPKSAFSDLFSGGLEEWRVGFEFSTPLGNRIGRAAERNAELLVARETALLREIERQISHQLAESFCELDRAYALARSTYNAFDAAKAETQQREGRVDIERDGAGLFLLLDARQRQADAEIAFYRSVIDYNLALLNLQFARGTLLNHMQVALTEGPWSQAAHVSAAKQSRRFRDGTAVGHVRQDLAPVSAGVYDQYPPIADDAP